METQAGGFEVAVIGMAGRFPGANDIDAYWRNLCDGVESIRVLSREELAAHGADPGILDDPRYVPAVSELQGVELFDALFFGINHREAELMDPQQRIFLQSAWHALENAGYDPGTYQGAIGVFGGATTSTYMLFHLATNPDVVNSVDRLQLLVGNAADSLTTRIAYKLNLRGPSFTIQCACSTSLVAVHVACQSLINGECDMALAGGVSANLSQRTGYQYVEGSILSPDGHCRVFDDEARGTVFGSGVGIVVLKRLDDALADGDYIHAVIKGTAVNNDGSFKVGYTAPSVEGQAKVISEAIAAAGVDAARISYIEAHGTGTNLGDPIEIQALTKAFKPYTDKKQFCAIGSVKANIGHLDVAAGVAGLIKTILALERGFIPPSLHFRTPNSKIDFKNSPVYVNNALTSWKSVGGPRLAGVSSFGFGGTNAHVILEEGPPARRDAAIRSHELLVLSAKTPSALDAVTARLAEYLKQSPGVNLPDVAYTLKVGRRAFPFRRALVCQDVDDATTCLGHFDPQRVVTNSGLTGDFDRPVSFMFTGQGSQYVNMARDIYETEPLFRERIDRCSEILIALTGIDLRTMIYPEESEREWASRQLDQTATTQPALFVLEYALASLWMEWGLQPHSMIGHSSGEYVAACLAGVFSLENALRIVSIRGRLIQSMPAGAMAAMPMSADALEPFLSKDLNIAAINEPSRCVVSGPEEAMAGLEQRLRSEGVQTQRLRTSHAFHSHMMEQIVAPFVNEVRMIKLNPPQIPFISNVTGKWITAGEAMDPEYWGRHLRQAVRFADGVSELSKIPHVVFLEIGPGKTLAAFAKKCTPVQEIHCSIRHPRERCSDTAFLLGTLARLWLAGVPVSWHRFHAHEDRQRIPLPVYPFEERRYWIEPGMRLQMATDIRVASTGAEALGGHDPAIESSAPAPMEHQEPSRHGQMFHPRPMLQTSYIAPRGDLERGIASIWRQVLGLEMVGVEDSFFDLGGDSLLATQLVSRLNQAYEITLPMGRLFEEPTVARIAELLILSKVSQTDRKLVDQILSETMETRISSAQSSLVGERA